MEEPPGKRIGKENRQCKGVSMLDVLKNNSKEASVAGSEREGSGMEMKSER